MDITHSARIAASRSSLVRTLTTREGIGGWYTPATTAEATIGAIVECTFNNYGSLQFRVDELDPARRISWTVVKGPPEWIDTTIAFTFTAREDEDAIDLEFRHAGLPRHYSEHSAFNYLWGEYVRSIKMHAETGVGEPFGSVGSKSAGTIP